MNKHDFDRARSVERSAFPAKSRARARALEPQANAAALIGRLFYAVLVVGFMGYYFGRMMQSIRG